MPCQSIAAAEQLPHCLPKPSDTKIALQGRSTKVAVARYSPFTLVQAEEVAVRQSDLTYLTPMPSLRGSYSLTQNPTLREAHGTTPMDAGNSWITFQGLGKHSSSPTDKVIIGTPITRIQIRSVTVCSSGSDPAPL